MYGCVFFMNILLRLIVVGWKERTQKKVTFQDCRFLTSSSSSWILLRQVKASNWLHYSIQTELLWPLLAASAGIEVQMTLEAFWLDGVNVLFLDLVWNFASWKLHSSDSHWPTQSRQIQVLKTRQNKDEHWSMRIHSSTWIVWGFGPLWFTQPSEKHFRK